MTLHYLNDCLRWPKLKTSTPPWRSTEKLAKTANNPEQHNNTCESAWLHCLQMFASHIQCDALNSIPQSSMKIPTQSKPMQSYVMAVFQNVLCLPSFRLGLR